jgi:hypothetical protein
MQDFSQLPSKTVTEVLMLEVRRCLFVMLKFTYDDIFTDENVAGGKNLSHFGLSAIDAGCC